jgi:polyhydroxybutyrate depolymerase
MKRFLLTLLGLFFIPLSSYSGQPALQPGDYTRRVKVNGLVRAYVIHISFPYDPAQPVPVILAFHGGFGTPAIFRDVTRLDARAGPAGFFVVYPEAYKRSWNAGDCCGPAQSEGVDDVAFVRALLHDLASIMTVDPRRIFATGSSNGAMFVYRLACELSDQIAAVATSAGAMALPDGACRPTRPVPVLHFHGLADEYAPFNGGPSKYRPAGVRRSVPGTTALWLRRDGCTDETRVTYQRGAATCTTHPNCQGEAEVTLCAIARMGHQWPGGKVSFPRAFGPGTTDIAASDMLVTFFQHHPMPANP